MTIFAEVFTLFGYPFTVLAILAFHDADTFVFTVLAIGLRRNAVSIHANAREADFRIPILIIAESSRIGGDAFRRFIGTFRRNDDTFAICACSGFAASGRPVVIYTHANQVFGEAFRRFIGAFGQTFAILASIWTVGQFPVTVHAGFKLVTFAEGLGRIAFSAFGIFAEIGTGGIDPLALAADEQDIVRIAVGIVVAELLLCVASVFVTSAGTVQFTLGTVRLTVIHRLGIFAAFLAFGTFVAPAWKCDGFDRCTTTGSEKSDGKYTDNIILFHV